MQEFRSSDDSIANSLTNSLTHQLTNSPTHSPPNYKSAKILHSPQICNLYLAKSSNDARKYEFLLKSMQKFIIGTNKILTFVSHYGQRSDFAQKQTTWFTKHFH